MAGSPRLKFSNKFRDYQKKAIRIVRRYRTAFLNSTTEGAALVCHPTGTGKTAVIAGLAHGCPEIGSVVVLTTREAVRDQLVRELAGNLFIDEDKFALGDRVELPKVVFVMREGADGSESAASVHAHTQRLLTSPALKAFADKQFARLVDQRDATLASTFAQGRAVIVMTVQMLASLESRSGESGSLYKILAKYAALVLFDEGHYEPAAVWSKVVRGLKRPLVLLSATPFRNDLKPFRINAVHIDIYRYAEAWGSKYVRKVEVKSRTGTQDARAFCADVIDFCTGQFGGERDRWPRVIIHCDDKSRITRLGEAFIEKSFSVVGIHDRFPERHDPGSWLRRKVPPPKDTEAQIWIHQYKLMEGIDDHRFRVLAFFDPMRNVRSVVQQIGRIIRRKPGESEDPAFVLDHYRGRLRQYLKADSLAKSLSRFYLDAFIKEHPQVDYIDRKFRRRLVMEEIKDGADEILFPRRVSFKRVSAGASLEDFSDLIADGFEIADSRYVKCLETGNAVMYLYANIVNPEFLHSRFFAEVRHGARLLILLPQHKLLAIADTAEGGRIGNGLGLLEPVKVSQLERLLTPGRLGRISSVTSQNTNLGNRVVRRRTISAPSISEVPPILDEHGHVLSTITGYNGDRPRIRDDLAYGEPEIGEDFTDRSPDTEEDGAEDSSDGPALLRRYIGLNSGHVSEVGAPLRFGAFCEWIDSLVDQMKTGGRTPGVFHRYARIASRAVARGAARNLLLDLYDLQDFYIHEKTNKPLLFDELCVDRKSTRSGGKDKSVAEFEVVLNGEVHPVEVVFFKSAQRYRLESDSLDEAFLSSYGDRRIPLSRALNERQTFSVIPEDLEFIYVHGRFYAPGLKFGARFRQENFFVGQCLYPSAKLKALNSEKGRCVLGANGRESRSDGEKYDDKSLFGLIDGWCSGFDSHALALSKKWLTAYKPEQLVFEPTLVICDDMDAETADFILADEEHRRVVVVHAKASATWRPYSASAIQEICAQAFQMGSRPSVQRE